mgnify:CR=1 FL=1
MASASALGICSMNPWIDAGLIFVFAAGCIALSFEIPRAVNEIRLILKEAADEKEADR